MIAKLNLQYNENILTLHQNKPNSFTYFIITITILTWPTAGHRSSFVCTIQCGPVLVRTYLHKKLKKILIKKFIFQLQKSHQIDTTEYQHTQISMEQLHQAMQSSLNAGTIVHNFQLPLSPRQMSTLMLKTNLHSFNEMPAHFRNLELNFAQNLSDQNLLRHEDILTQNLNRNIDISLVRSLGNEIDLQNSLSIAQNLSEDLRLNDMQLSQIRSDLPHTLSHELDLSHHMNRQSMEQDILQDEARRMVIQCVPDSNLLEGNLGQSVGQRLDQVLFYIILPLY